MSEPLIHPPQPAVTEDEESRFAGLEDWLATFIGLAIIVIGIAGLIPGRLVP